ncbi:MAG TPA: 2-oxoglutarate dehydrogenase E1 component [Opitutales bacterium]|nr:2-oxoglutarate dehydrogenase E1 component [Opitutales bacterium]
MKNLSFANRWNADLIDQYYENWLRQPESLEPDWRAFFEGFELGQTRTVAAPAATSTATMPAGVSPETSAPIDPILQAKAIGAIYAFRGIGHTQAHLNPLQINPPENPRLSLERLGFSTADLDRACFTGNFLHGGMMTVRELLRRLHEIYCGSIGIEYLHIQDTKRRRWLQARLEPTSARPNLSHDEKLRALRKITEAETFEHFLHTRYVGQKRFSLEGGETIIAALDALIERCPDAGVEEIVMGMAHRGRLNVLVNIVGKSYDYLFREFSENYIPDATHGDGDVKYHLGYEADPSTSKGQKVHVVLAANPSHLEAVDPVVQGKARARLRRRGDMEGRKKVVPVLIHGDAAFIGQGVVAEVFNLSRLDGYRTGGTLHFVINNQIGFTTEVKDARSSMYCTDIAKMIEVPIFHVNGDDPLAMVMVTQLALDYRQVFNDDVVIDMYCYRRHGHNEGDEPGFTQPTLYRLLAEHPHISATLAKRLIADGDLTVDQAVKIQEQYQQNLDVILGQVRKDEEAHKEERRQKARSAVFRPHYSFESQPTAVAKENLEQAARILTTVPEGFNANPKILRQLETKRENFQKGEGLDWGMGEALAFATLLQEGTPVRLSGQDVERGTFSHRHAVLYDMTNRAPYVPLSHISPTQPRFCVHNSSLSEYAILGFDYGYSLDYPEMLCLWEAQFGDFANGAQVIIDQFITSSESKWQRTSGIVMLLPHGYEGQGPEHSSGRVERFLQACAENNIQVCNLTTPAQYFHALRRQMKRDFRKPLIIMSPKSLLRHKECVSRVSDFTDGRFQEILDDPVTTQGAKRLIFCSGKVYYDLHSCRVHNNIRNTAILRVEQFYPLNTDLLQTVLKNHAGYEKIIWCQEEPRNMGGWTFMAPIIEQITGMKPIYAGRKASASPACGSINLHKLEQDALVEHAFNA